MPKVPAIIPVTDLRQGAAAALKRVRTSRQPVVVTQRGRAAAILLSVEAYEDREHERELLLLLARALGQAASSVQRNGTSNKQVEASVANAPQPHRGRVGSCNITSPT